MKKYNNYKKYYESHKEQEKKRTNAYYHEHRDEILVRKKAKRDSQPKSVKLTLKERLAITEKALELACEEGHSFIIESEGCWFGADSKETFDWFDDLSTKEKIIAHCNYFKNKAKEMLKDD